MLLLAFGICAGCFSGLEAGVLNFTVGNTNTVAGGSAEIPIVVTGAPTNLSAFCFFLTNAASFGLPAVQPGSAQTNLVTFVDDFGNRVYRITGFVTNDPPIGNGTVANLIYGMPANAVAGAYPLPLTAAPPTNAPAGPNPEARSLATSDLIASTGANGSILVLVVTPPYLANLTALANGAIQFGFTNASGASFSVLATTNLALPLSNWMVIGTAAQLPAGQYQFTDIAATNYPLRFYSVRSP
jgi:hypothetical protein